MHEVKKLLQGITIPCMINAEQYFETQHLTRDEIPDLITKELTASGILRYLKPGMRIALTAGSRKIQNIDLILSSIVALLRHCGTEPFLVPAMGSHGGATAEGQRQLLQHYGITEDACLCPIFSSMDTVRIGTAAEGQPVFIDRYAAESDGILIVGRVKAHTSFRGQYESGLLKMMVVGLGKQLGANICHRQGFSNIEKNLRQIGNVILSSGKILGAVAILENAFDQTYRIVGLLPDEILFREPILLKQAKDIMPQLFFNHCDVLIVDEIGKNISGTGMDPNVTGRFLTPFASGGIRAERIVVLRLSKLTAGNGYGIGAADCTTERVLQELDREAMYVNGLTCRGINSCKIPCAFPNDRMAIQAAIALCSHLDGRTPTIIRIPNTQDLKEIQISESLYDMADTDSRIHINGAAAALPFDSHGNLPI